MSSREKVDLPKERRSFPRFKTRAFLGFPIKLKPLPPFFGTPLMGQLIDLSPNGMAILIGEEIPVGTDLELQLTFPDRAVLDSNVRIRHVLSHKGRFLIGIEFIDLADFLQVKLERITKDFLECEDKIKIRAPEICRLDCSFFNICDKMQKLQATHKLDEVFQLKLKSRDF